MIPKSEISQCVENMMKSEIGKVFVNGKVLEEYCVKIYEVDPYFYEYYEKKKKLLIMVIVMYYLELMFAFMNTFQLQKLMKKGILTEILSLKKRARSIRKKT